MHRRYVTMSTMSERRRRESGVVSIMVTMITMIVISLIVLGFADISRNEQRNSLDAQLSTQAYYAAESGVNDARAAMETLMASGNPVTDKTTCGNSGSSYNFNSSIDASHNVSYSCVLINSSPPVLSYNVGYTSTVIPILSNGGAFGRLTLTWKPANGTVGNLGNCYPAGGNNVGDFTVAGQWNCNWPVLRIDLFDANNASITRGNWNRDTSTYFLVPYNSGANSNFGLGGHGSAVRAQCLAGAATCSVNITGVSGKKYYMRVTTLYRTDSLLTISTNGGSKFTGAEAIIDSTGKAQDVLRRILVAVDLTDSNARTIPSAAIVTKDSVCKRYGVTANSFNVYNDIDQSQGSGGNVYCNQQSDGTPSP